MAKVTNFEELDCWKASRQLVRRVYLLSDAVKLSRGFRRLTATVKIFELNSSRANTTYLRVSNSIFPTLTLPADRTPLQFLETDSGLHL